MDWFSPLIINSILIVILLGVIFYYYNIISKTIGIKTLMFYYQAWKGRDTGKLLIRVYNEDGNVNYYVGTKQGSKLITTNINGEKKESSFILNSEAIYRNELGLNCIDFYEKDIDPRDWRTGEIVVTSPIALQNIVTNATKAEVLSNSMQDFFIKHFKIIGIGILILIGVLGFIILSQNGDITSCYQQMSSIKVVAQ